MFRELHVLLVEDNEVNMEIAAFLLEDSGAEVTKAWNGAEGLEKFKDTDGYYVFHAGTKFDEDGDIVTNGGRVLGVTAKGKDLKEARANAYKATEWIDFANKYMRHDIGHAIDEA